MISFRAMVRRLTAIEPSAWEWRICLRPEIPRRAVIIRDSRTPKTAWFAYLLAAIQHLDDGDLQTGFPCDPLTRKR